MTVFEPPATNSEKPHFKQIYIQKITFSEKTPSSQCTYIGKIEGALGKLHPVYWTNNKRRVNEAMDNLIENAKAVGANYVTVDPANMPTKQFNALKAPILGQAYFCPY